MLPLRNCYPTGYPPQVLRGSSKIALFPASTRLLCSVLCSLLLFCWGRGNSYELLDCPSFGEARAASCTRTLALGCLFRSVVCLPLLLLPVVAVRFVSESSAQYVPCCSLFFIVLRSCIIPGYYGPREIVPVMVLSPLRIVCADCLLWQPHSISCFIVLVSELQIRISFVGCMYPVFIFALILCGNCGNAVSSLVKARALKNCFEARYWGILTQCVEFVVVSSSSLFSLRQTGGFYRTCAFKPAHPKPKAPESVFFHFCVCCV